MIDATAADGFLGDRTRDQCRKRPQAMVLLASTGALVQVTSGFATMIYQSLMRMKLERLERKQVSSVLAMVEHC